MGEDIAPTLISGVYKQNGTTQDNLNVIVLENHPMDSRMKIKEDGIFQTMGARSGGGERPSHIDGHGGKNGHGNC